MKNAGEKLRLEDLIQSTEDQLQGKVVGLTVPENDKYALELRARLSPDQRRPSTHFINPYNEEILEESQAVRSFFFFNFRLHRWLLLPNNIGGPIVGITTIGFTLLLFTGLYLWWPKSKKHFFRSIKVKLSGRWRKINYDLHNSLGFWSLGVLLIMALTGLCWSFEWYKNGASWVMGAEVFGGRRQAPTEINTPTNMDKLPLAAIITTAHEKLPYQGIIRINFPNAPHHTLTVTKTSEEFLSVRGSDKIEFNPYTGEIVKLELFKDKPFNQQIVDMVRPLHTGEFLGGISKFIYFFGSLIATFLPITGFLIWWNKLKKKPL